VTSKGGLKKPIDYSKNISFKTAWSGLHNKRVKAEIQLCMNEIKLDNIYMIPCIVEV